MIANAPSRRLHELDDLFADHVEQLHPKLIELIGCVPFTYQNKPRGLPSEVVYLFSDDSGPLYIGRSRKFTQRLGNHCRPSSQANQSSFAYKMACRAVGYTPELYKKGQSWAASLDNVNGLRDAFDAAKRKMSAMEIRYVNESDPVRQALLEIYCSVALKTQNSWKTS